MASPLAKTSRYRDLDLVFSPNPISKDVPKKLDVLAVLRSCRHLVLLAAHEKPFHPEIGAEIRRYLFEPLSIITIATIDSDIRNVIENYEPRAKVTNIDIVPDDGNAALDISIEIEVLDLQVPATLQLTLKRLR